MLNIKLWQTIAFHAAAKLNYLLYQFSKLSKLEKSAISMDVFVKYPEVLWLNINEQNSPRVLKAGMLKIRISKGVKYKNNM